MILSQDLQTAFAAVKDAARGRWRELLPALLGWPSETCDGRNRPCPRCGGRDRFRFTDYGSDGSVICNQCAPSGIGDGIDALVNFGRASKADALRMIAVRLGMNSAPSGEWSRPTGGYRPKTRQAPTHEERAAVRAEAPAAVAKFQAQLTSERLDSLALETGVPAWAWSRLGVGYADGDDLPWFRVNGGEDWRRIDPTEAWIVPEYAGCGEIVGFSARSRGGAKGTPRGGTRGLTLPVDWHTWEASNAPIHFPEGASDTAALLAMGRLAAGRPSKNGGVELLAQLVRQLQIDAERLLVVGENDRLSKGWPGRDGAMQTAEKLSRLLGRRVRWTLPPEGSKDVRAFYMKRARRESER